MLMSRCDRPDIRNHKAHTAICARCRHRKLLRSHRSKSPLGQDQHQPTLRSTHKGVAQSGSGRQRHIHANGSRDATRRSAYTSYRVAKKLPIEFSTSIPRSQLRPGYGEGFLGAPLEAIAPHEGPMPREQGDRRGPSRTKTTAAAEGPCHVCTESSQPRVDGTGV